MKKRVISFLLIISLIILPIMVTAVENNPEMDKRSKNDNDLVYYDEIPVLITNPEITKTLFEINDTEDSFEINKRNVEIARKGVLDLNLSDKNLYFIEEVCLAELEEIEKTPNCILNEYTVLIPQTKASTPSFYARYSGRDYYSSLTSRSNLTLSKNKFAKGEKIASWFDNVISLGLFFDNIWQISLIQTVAGASLPSNYSVHYSDWMDSHININPTNRAIYAKEGTTFVNLANREFGKVRPYFVYHCNDATATVPTVTFYYDYYDYPDVTSSNNSSLLYIAKNVYDTGANPVSIYLKNVVSIGWR